MSRPRVLTPRERGCYSLAVPRSQAVGTRENHARSAITDFAYYLRSTRRAEFGQQIHEDGKEYRPRLRGSALRPPAKPRIRAPRGTVNLGPLAPFRKSAGHDSIVIGSVIAARRLTHIRLVQILRILNRQLTR